MVTNKDVTMIKYIHILPQYERANKKIKRKLKSNDYYNLKIK